MQEFNNSKMIREASNSQNWKYIGHYGDSSSLARIKAIELYNKGQNAFYKRIIENGRVNYHVYIF